MSDLDARRREALAVAIDSAAGVRKGRFNKASNAVSAQYGTPCDFCGAEPFKPCRTKRGAGRVTDTHEARLRAPVNPHRYLPLAERFWFSVSKGPDCWNWTGAKWAEGYGRIKLAGRYLLAHRVSYELHVGPIPEGLTIDHLCRNKACVRPDHLEPVTTQENTRRAVEARRAELLARADRVGGAR